MNICKKVIFLFLLFSFNTDATFCQFTRPESPKNLQESGGLQKPTMESYALLIATDQYENWSDLRNPYTDAQALEKVLKRKYGFSTELLRNPVKSEIRAKIKAYLEHPSQDNSQLFIYFTGHGSFERFNDLVSEEGRGYYIPTDAEINDEFGDSYLPFSIIIPEINNMPYERILLVVDACYSGSIFGEVKGLQQIFSQRDRLIDEVNQYTSRLGITSGGINRTSDGVHFSPLTRALLNAFATNGGPDSVLTMSEVFAKVQALVPKAQKGAFSERHNPNGDFLFLYQAEPPQQEATADLPDKEIIAKVPYTPPSISLGLEKEVGLNKYFSRFRFSSDRKRYVLTSDGNKIINVYDSNTNQPILNTLEAHNESIGLIKFFNNDQTLVSAAGDKVVFWDLLEGRITKVIERKLIRSHNDYYVGYQFFQDKLQILEHNPLNDMIQLYDINKESALFKHKIRRAPSAALHPSKEYFVVGGFDGKLTVYHLDWNSDGIATVTESDDPKTQYIYLKDRINDMVFTHDGQFLLLTVGHSEFSEEIRVYDSTSWKLVHTTKFKESGNLHSMHFSQNQKHLIITKNKKLYFYRVGN